ncbi:MAG: ABC transporter substrate-binding protein [Alphaproteobacteria bacterium]|nr:ABC transporter substrate-binding protein [Alphaproteobacteria bacterium]
MVGAHIFDSLTRFDAEQNLRPALAESWRALDDRTWEFKLRAGVRFSDGSAFGAEDVVATIHRVAWVPNSPSRFTPNTASIVETQIVDPLTIRFVTRAPTPLLPADLSVVQVVSRACREAPTADFNSGRAAIGTGPYKLVSFMPGERVELARNELYWGAAEPWARVSLRLISNSAARVAALLSGAVDMIDSVPTAQMARLRDEPRVEVFSVTSSRLIALLLDHHRESTPFALDKTTGQPLARNPLRDLKVRRALSLAINRAALCERVMEGQATPAGQVLPDGFFGTVPGLAAPRFDPDAARALLAEAGYANGFRLTLHGPNDRYVNDSQVMQAVAQMWTRVGVETRVEAITFPVFVTQMSRHEFSSWLVGWAPATGETSNPLRALAHSFEPDRGLGAINRGRYSNPPLDALIREASATIDEERRKALLQQAGRIVAEDVPFMPLYFERSSWAARRGLRTVPRVDQHTLAMGTRPTA